MTQLLDHSHLAKGTLQSFGLSSSASPQPNEKETNHSAEKEGPSRDKKQDESVKQNVNGKASDQADKQDTEGDLSFDDLVKIAAEKDELLKTKQKEVIAMQDKVLRTYAEIENVLERTKRESENSKKFAIQNFAKCLLDVADNLGRASSVVKDSFSKIDQTEDSVGAVPLLKTLLEGVEMTDKQLAEVFRKFGVEKFDPTNEPFDPNSHLAVFQVPDASKPPGTVAAVLKAGYMLYDRVIRPAEVGVTQALNDEADQGSAT